MSTQIWKVSVNGQEHEVSFKRGIFFNNNKLLVDGEEQNIERNLHNNYIGFDVPIMIGDKECRFVRLGNKSDVVVDGLYVSSSRPYMPFNKLEWWSWIFVSMCVVVVLFTGGGLLPILLALFGVSFCLQIAVRPDLNLINKVMLSLLIVAAIWLVAYGFIYYISS